MVSSLPPSRALAALSLATCAGIASAQPAKLPAVPATKASDAALVEIGKGKLRGAPVAIGRAELQGGVAAMVVASQPRAGTPVAFELLLFGDTEGGITLLGSDELEMETVGTPVVGVVAGAHPVASGAVTTTIGWKAVDGSGAERVFIHRHGNGRLARLYAGAPVRSFPPGSGRESVREAIQVLPTSAGGFADLRVRTTTSECRTAADCSESIEVTSWRFDGVRYVERPYPIPFLETIAASSELSSPGGLVDYSASAAVDGRTETAWCEGARGAGWFEKLELTFSPAQRVKGLTIFPGIGTPEGWTEVTKPRRLRIVLPDGRKIEGDLADEPRAQRIAIPEGDRVFGMTVVIVDVYKGKREDACIAELGVEVEP